MFIIILVDNLKPIDKRYWIGPAVAFMSITSWLLTESCWELTQWMLPGILFNYNLEVRVWEKDLPSVSKGFEHQLPIEKHSLTLR